MGIKNDLSPSENALASSADVIKKDVIKIDRRALLKKTLIAGGAGYVAPLILGTASPASAQVVSGLTCASPGCGEEANSCAGGDCACVSVVEGGTACVLPLCFDYTTCEVSTDCPDGWVCFTSGCCDDDEEQLVGPFCVALCGTEVEIPIQQLAGRSRGQSTAARRSSRWRR